VILIIVHNVERYGKLLILPGSKKVVDGDSQCDIFWVDSHLHWAEPSKFRK